MASPSEAFARVLKKHPHVCAFFNSVDEEYETLLPFIREGFEVGDKAFHIVDSKLRHGHLRRLEEAGVPVKDAEAKQQFELRNWEDAYLRDGHFDQRRMLSMLEEVLGSGKAQGFPLTRLVAHMEWALEDRPGVNDIVEYETRLNYLLPKYPDPVICTYDLTKIDGTLVVDIMRTHPAVILGGVLQENPFFVPPDTFLRELNARAVPARDA
jgi:hypothetical protein